MITTITRFQLPPGVPTEAIKKGFLEVAPKFKNPSGLLRKYFLISEDGKTSGGVHLWNSSEEARTFSEGVLHPMTGQRITVPESQRVRGYLQPSAARDQAVRNDVPR